MKHSLLLFSFVFAFQYAALSQYECLADSAYYYQNPTDVSNNTPSIITHTVAYDANNKPLEVYYFNANLDTTGIYLNTFNAYGKQLTGLYQSYVAGAFVNSSYEVFTYANDTILLEYKYSDLYDQPTDTWTFNYFQTFTYNDVNFPSLPTSKENKSITNGIQTYGDYSTYTYTNFGKINYNSYQNWNSSIAAYENNSQRFYTYNSNQLNDTLFTEMWYNNGWIPTSLNVYAYNANGLQSEQYNWQYQTGIGYVYYSHNLTYYNAQNQVDSLLTFLYDGTQFNPHYRETKFYNANHKLTLEMGYDMTSGQPVNAYKYERIYSNTFGDLIQFKNSYWDVANSVWILQILQNYYNSCIDVTGLEEAQTSHLVCYPNPFTHELTLQSEQVEPIMVIDLKGQTVLSSVLNKGMNVLELGHLENGIYFIKSSKGTQRIVKQ